MRFLYIAALASMLILLGTVIVVVRNIRLKSQEKEGGVEEVPASGLIRHEEPPVILKTTIDHPPLRPQTSPENLEAPRLEHAADQRGRPQPAVMLLGMMAGAALLVLAHSQKRSAASKDNRPEG